jgi:hypothetical protein
MKKIAAAVALSLAGVCAQAATVGWQFEGTTYVDDKGVVPFSAYVEVDTGRMARGPNPDGPGSAIGGFFRWGTSGSTYCRSHALLSHYSTTDASFVLGSLDTADCGITVWVTGALGTGRFEVEGDPLTQWYDMSGPDLQIQVSMMGPVLSAQSLTVDYTYQMIPEPSPVALIGAGLAGLF